MDFKKHKEHIDNSRHPIGVFDSGLGGLTVVEELMREMPSEDVIYLGDSARVPYGIKSLDTVRRFAVEEAKFLMQFSPKAIVVACNTASAAAIDAIEESCDVPVIDVICPGSTRAVENTDGLIGVLATEATVFSRAYNREIEKLDPDREVLAVACPLLVPIVEEGRDADDPIVTHVLCDYLRDLQRRRPKSVILGCTHYPLLSQAIKKLLGPGVVMINSGSAAAEQAKKILTEENLLNQGETSGELNCYTTDNPDRFAKLAGRFCEKEIGSVRYVGTDELEDFCRENKLQNC